MTIKTTLTRIELFDQLCKDEGLTREEWLEAHGDDCPAIGVCTSCGTMSNECDPDTTDGRCEYCGEETVESALILLGVI